MRTITSSTRKIPTITTILMVVRGLAAARAVVSTVRSSAHPFPAATLIAMETGSGSSWSSHTAALRSWPGAKWAAGLPAAAAVDHKTLRDEGEPSDDVR